MSKPKSLKAVCGGFHCGKGIKLIDRKTLGLAGGKLPTPTAADEGKVLGVKNGQLAFIEREEPIGGGFYLKNMTTDSYVTVTLKATNSVDPYINLQKSEDGVRWTDVSFTSYGGASLRVTKKLYLRGNNPNGIYNSALDSSTRTYKFSCAKDYGAYGDITTLIAYDGGVDTLPENAFQYLFHNSTTLKHAPELPSTNLAKNCYSLMFAGCTGLTSTPELPATVIPEGAYSSMFARCSGLTSMPDLSHVTTVGREGLWTMFGNCPNLNPTGNELAGITSTGFRSLEGMFTKCTSLTNAPFPTSLTSISEKCCDSMFSGCTALVTPPELPATTVDKEGYKAMFAQCSALATAPDLPATTVGADAYLSMFKDCTSLTHGAIIAAVDPAPSGAYCKMYMGCSALLDAPDMLATEAKSYAYSEMFEDCTSLVNAPEFMATTLGAMSFNKLFMNCTNLNSVKIHFTDWTGIPIGGKWLYGTPPTGTFYCPPELDTDYVRDTDYVPVGWTVVRI